MNPTYGTALARAASAAQPGLAGSPNGNSAQIQHLQNLGALQFRAGGTSLATNAFGGEASSVADQEEAARQAAEAAADAEAKKQAIRDKIKAELTDPDNYVRSVSEDGGYNFYRPDGTPITVQEYSQATGKQIDKALEGSNNSVDNQFTEDYKRLKEYGAAMAGDEDARKAFTESKAGKAFLANPENKNKTYAEIVAEFKKHYSSYMQPQQIETMATKDTAGNDIRSNILGGTGAGMLSDWLNGRRQNVNYI